MAHTSCFLLLFCYFSKLNALTPDEQSVVKSGLQWLKCTEGFKNYGDYPTTLSGITIGSGIDLGQTTEAVLRNAGVDEATLAKMHPYFGFKSEAEAVKAGNVAKNLILTTEKAEEITYKYVVYMNLSTVALEYGSLMSPNGRDVLVSLQHWAGKRGLLGSGTKLAPGGTNWIKKAIEDKQGTDHKLVIALCKTVKDCATCTDGKRNRFKREKNHSKQVAGCSDA